MTEFLELTLSGLSLGCIYALIAIGFVLVFKATGVVNFAHGSILLLGAYVAASVQVRRRLLARAGDRRRGRPPSAPRSSTSLLMRRLRAGEAGDAGDPHARRRHHPRDRADAPASARRSCRPARRGARRSRTSASSRSRRRAWPPRSSRVVLIAAFTVALQRTDWGVAMRAAAADGRTAALMGIRLNRVAAGAWALAGALAAVAGVFFTSFPSAGVDNTTGLSALAAIPAAVLGGLDSLAGALVGGLIVGLVATYCAGYQGELSFLGRGLSDVAPYAVMLLVLLVRPAGLFGTQAVTRV